MTAAPSQTPEAAGLEPCPFCGGTTIMTYSQAITEGPDFYWHKCGDCGAETEGDYGQDAAAAVWNRRVTAASAQAAIDAEKAKVAELEAENEALTKALTGLTCGGSEFFARKGDRYVADIKACVDWVCRAKTNAHRRFIEAIKRATAAEARADRLAKALKETRNRVREWPIDDHETCMCGSPVASHGMGDGHSPVSQGDHAISMIVEAINEALQQETQP